MTVTNDDVADPGHLIDLIEAHEHHVLLWFSNEYGAYNATRVIGGPPSCSPRAVRRIGSRSCWQSLRVLHVGQDTDFRCHPLLDTLDSDDAVPSHKAHVWADRVDDPLSI